MDIKRIKNLLVTSRSDSTGSDVVSVDSAKRYSQEADKWLKDVSYVLGKSENEFTPENFISKTKTVANLAASGSNILSKLKVNREYLGDEYIQKFESMLHSYTPYLMNAKEYYKGNPYEYKYIDHSVEDIAEIRENLVREATSKGEFIHTPGMNSPFKGSERNKEIDALTRIEAYKQSQSEDFESAQTARSKADKIYASLVDAEESEETAKQKKYADYLTRWAQNRDTARPFAAADEIRTRIENDKNSQAYIKKGREAIESKEYRADFSNIMSEDMDDVSYLVGKGDERTLSAYLSGYYDRKTKQVKKGLEAQDSTYIKAHKLGKSVYDKIGYHPDLGEDELNTIYYMLGREMQNGGYEGDVYVPGITEANPDEMEVPEHQNYADDWYEAQKKAEKTFEKLKDKTILELAYKFGEGIVTKGLGGIVKSLYGGENTVPYASELVSDMIQEDLADSGFKLPDWLGGYSLGQAAGSMAESFGQMVPSIAVGAIPVVGSVAGPLSFGLSASGNAKYELMRKGYDEKTSAAYGVLVGAAEAGLQALLGGINIGTKGTVKDLSEKFVNGIENGFLRYMAKGGVSGGLEAIEEGSQEILAPVFEYIVTNGESDAIEELEIGNILFASLQGFTMGGGMSNFEYAAENAPYINSKSTEFDIDMVNRLIEEGLTKGTGTEAYKISARVNQKIQVEFEKAVAEGVSAEEANARAIKKVSRADFTQLQQAVMSSADADFEVSVKKRLEELGEKGDTTVLVQAIYKKVQGIELSVQEKSALKNSKYGQRVLNEYENAGTEGSAENWTEDIDGAYDRETYGRKKMVAPLGESAETQSKVEAISETPLVTKAHPRGVAAEIKGKDAAGITGVASKTETETVLSTSKGETVRASDVTFDDPFIQDIMEQIESDYDTNTANAVLEAAVSYKNFKDGKGGAGSFLSAFDTLYRVAEKEGLEFSSAMNRVDLIRPITTLGMDAARSAMNAGLVSYEARYQAKEVAQNANKITAATKKATVTVGKDIKVSKGVENTLERIAALAKADVVVENFSEGDESRGYYVDGVIHLNADKVSDSASVYVAIHEVVHHLKANNAKGYSVLEKYITNYLSKKGHNVDNMVKNLQKSRQKYGEKLSYEDALEELVCNTMSEIATDEDAMATFLELNESERKTLISVLRDIANKIREWARSLTGKEYRRLVTESENLRHLANELNKQLKAVEGNAQVQGERKNLYAGFFADTAPSTFVKAERMSENGVDSETIRKETGWFKGLDGKWRFEIDDSEAQFSKEGDMKLRENPRYLRLVELSDKKTLTSAEQTELSKLEKEFEEDVWRTKWRLDDYLKHDKLFATYPLLGMVNVDFQNLPDSRGGYYSSKSNTIVLNRKITNEKQLLSIVLHEIQHNIQHREGFATGASPEYWQSRLDNGFDSRSKDTLQEEAELRTQYDEIATNEPEFYGDMKALEEMHPDVPRAPVNWDTLETIGEDPVEWQRYDSQRDALVEKYSEEKVYSFMFLQDKLRRVATKGARTAHELYHSTAGEVEARDAQNRQNLTDEQRKNTRPDIDRQNVVFADDSGVKYSRDDFSVDYSDLSVLDDEQIDVYNKRGWARDLFKAEDRVLLNQRMGEIFRPNSQYVRSTLADGTVVLDLNNKVLLVSGEYGNESIESVLTINATSEADAEFIKEDIQYELQNTRHNKGTFVAFLEFAQLIYGEESVRVFNRRDYLYIKGRVDEGNRASVPDDWQNYGYTTDKQDGRGVSEGSENGISRTDSLSKKRKYSYADEEVDLWGMLEPEEETAESTQRSEYLEGFVQTAATILEKTREISLSEGRVRGLANNVIRRYTGDYNTPLAQQVEDILLVATANESVSGYDVVGEIAAVMKKAITESEYTVDQFRAEREDVFNIMRGYGKIYLSDEQMSNLKDNDRSLVWFRGKLFGRVMVVSKDKFTQYSAAPLEEMYRHLAQEYPEWFDKDVPSILMPMELLRQLEELRPRMVGFEEVYMQSSDEIAVQMASDLLTRVVDAKYQANKTEELRTLRRQNSENRKKWLENQGSRKHLQNIERYAASMIKSITEPTKTRGIPDRMQQPVLDLLSAFDFTKGCYNRETGEPIKHDKNWADKMEVIAGLLETVGTHQQTNFEGGSEGIGYMDVDPYLVQTMREFAEEAGGKKLSQMSAEEIATLDGIMMRLKNAINSASKLYQNEMAAQVQELGENTIEEFGKRKRGRFSDSGDSVSKFDRAMSKVDQSLRWSTADAFTVEKMFGKYGGSVMAALYKGYEKVINNIDVIKQWVETHIDVKKVQEWRKDARRVVLQSGDTVTLTVPQIMELYVLNNRTQAQGHIYGSGIVIEATEASKKMSRQNHDIRRSVTKPYEITPADITKFTAQLTDEQIKLADMMQRYLTEDMAQLGNEVTLKRFLYKAYNTKHYWPIKVLGDMTKTTDQTINFASLYAVANPGFSKKTVEGANNAIVIHDIFDSFSQHCGNMALMNGLSIPLSDALKWYNYTNGNTGVKGEMREAFSKHANDWFIKFLSDLNNQQIKASPDTGIIDSFVKNSKSAAIWMNGRVVVQQFTSYPRAFAVLKAKHLMNPQALLRKGGVEKALKYCPIAKWKSWGFFTTDVGRSMKDIILPVEGVMEKVKSAGFWATAKADELTLGALWNACELQVLEENKGLERDTEECNLKTAELHTKVVNETQVVDTPFHRAQIRRNTDVYSKLMSSFMDEPLKSYNLLRNAFASKDKKKIGRAVVSFVVTAALCGALESLWDVFVRNANPDDEDEFWKKYLSVFSENTLDNLNIFKLHPIINKLWSVAEGWSSAGLDENGVKTLASSLSHWIKRFSGESNRTVYADLYETAKAISYITGFGIHTVMRDVVGIVNHFLPAGQKWSSTAPTKTKLATEAVNSLLAGDKEQYDSYYEDILKKCGGDQKKAQELIKKTLSETEEIQVIYNAYASGNKQVYEERITELEKKGFEFDTIMKAMKSYGNKQKEDTGENKEPEAERLYDTTIMIGVLESGDTDGFLEIVEHLKADGVSESSMKAKVTNTYKGDYVDAYLNGNSEEQGRIRNLLETTGFYEDLGKTLTDWVVADLKEQYLASDNPDERVKIRTQLYNTGKWDSYSELDKRLKKWRESE